MGEQVLLEGLGSGLRLGRGGEIVGQLLHPLVEVGPQLVVGVVGHVLEEAPQPAVEAFEDAVVDRVGHPPWRLGPEAHAERVAVGVEGLGDAVEDGREELLVPAVGDGQIEAFAEDGAGGCAAELAGQRLLDRVLHLVVLERVDHGR